MQSDLRNFGSLTFFEQNIDDIPEVPEPTDSIELPKALAEAEHMLDTGSSDFNEKTETILSVLYTSLIGCIIIPAVWLPATIKKWVHLILRYGSLHLERKENACKLSLDVNE